MNPDEICICGHTYEVHFGHECSVVGENSVIYLLGLGRGTDCKCKQFVSCELAVPIFEALELLCDACDLFVKDLDECQAIAPVYESARALIEKAKSQ